MIKYSLVCAGDHAFEGWFRSSVDFDEQAAEGALSCPHCATSDVRKGVMAPAIRSGRSADLRPDAGGAETGPVSERLEAFRGAIRADMAEAAQRARAYVEKHFDYVGERFPEEARRIHYGETPARPVYGEATPAEARELAEEGVEVAPLPGLPSPGAGGPVDKSKLN